MNEIILSTTVRTYSPAELPADLAALAQTALAAAGQAYAPYSKFQVGAAVKLANGAIVTGNNQENAAYPSGLCAERVALFYAGAAYPGVATLAIAIAAQTEGRQIEMITPCGACRQVLLETENRSGHPIEILLCGSTQVYVISGAASLLPLSFSGSDLGASRHL
jgi:cytidine deaminase